MDIDISRSCRSCLCESNDMHPICKSARSYENFGSFEKDSYIWNLSIAEVIMACTVVNISPDDGLPQSICSQCLQQIQQAFQFKEKCEAADLKLRRYSINKTDPISCIKTENDDEDQLFHPETVLVTEFDFDAKSDNERTSGNVDDVVKREKKKYTESVDKIIKKIKIEQIPSDVDEKTLMEQAEIVDGRYQCKFCEKSLADRQTYKLHIRLHTGTNLKRCSICDRGFAKNNHLERHLATHGKTHKCTSCTKAFLTTDERKKHEQSCSKLKSKDSSKPKDEEYHTKTDARIVTPTTDSKEGVLSGTEEQKESDEQVTVKPQVKTSMSEMRIKTRIPPDVEEQSLLKSVKMVNDRYECPICSKTLARREDLVLHIRTHTGKNLFPCTVCDKAFAKPYNLSRHMASHDSDNNLRMDETMSKSQQPDGSFCCTFCMKVFNERPSFRLHLRMHTGNKLRHCEICNQSFADEEELLEHMPVHGDCFPCVECDEVFKTFNDRKNHTKTEHTTAKTKKPSNTPPKRKTSYEDDDDEDEQLVNSAEWVNGRYNCNLCEKTLANRHTLKLHIRLHLQKKLKMCELCGQGFSKKYHLDRHFKTHFPKKPECKFCHATFESVQEMKSHMAATHKDEISAHKEVRTAIVPWTQPNGKKVCQCMICDSVFGQISALRGHLNWHANTTEWIHEVDLKSKTEYLRMFDELKDDEFTDEDKAKVLQTKLQENSHEVAKMYRIINDQGWELSFSDSETENEIDDDNERKRIYVCSENSCSRSYDRLYKLMCHTKADHRSVSKQCQCIHCLQCFPNSEILAKHLRQQCENETKTLHCTMCYSRFRWESSLANHFDVYHQSESKVLSRRGHTCDVCSKSFHTEQRLNEHRLRHSTEYKRFACDICDKRFARYDHLRNHIRSHIPPHERETIAKTHLCSYCGDCFSNSSNLKSHIRRHTGEKPYKCDLCSSSFRRSCDLSCHRRTHTGEKPYPCTVCGHRFSRSNKLARHMRIHTGEKRYKCTECDRAFTQSNDLTLHIRRHRGDKPFHCDCGERFLTNSLLQQHRRTHAH